MTDTLTDADASIPLTVVPGKTDRELAQDFRIRAQVILNTACEVMNEANVAGLEIGWIIVRSPLGKNVVQEVMVKRPL